MTNPTITHEPPVFDWYQATVEISGDDLCDLAATTLGDETPRRLPAKNGYARGWEIRREGSRAAVCMVGGSHEWPHIVGTGVDADRVARFCRRRTGVRHRVSRCDVAVDTDTPGAFAHLRDGLRLEAVRYGAQAVLMHDPDRAAAGATYYVGAKTSEVRARLYEKGKQMGDELRPGWVRYEVQLRPQKDRKTWAAAMPEADLLGAARWARSFAADYLFQTAPAPPARSRRVTDLDGSLGALMVQYGDRLAEHLEQHGGDLAAAFAHLMQRHGQPGGRLPEGVS